APFREGPPVCAFARIANRKMHLEHEAKPPAIKSRPSLRCWRWCSVRLGRLAPHAVLDPADRALAHTIAFGKGSHPLSSRQCRTDLADLNILNHRPRETVPPPRLTTIPQAVSRIAEVITQVKVIRPVVTRVIIMVADQLVPAELPTQDHAHHRNMMALPWTRCFQWRFARRGVAIAVRAVQRERTCVWSLFCRNLRRDGSVPRGDDRGLKGFGTPRWMSRPGRVPRASCTYIAQETAAISDGWRAREQEPAMIEARRRVHRVCSTSTWKFERLVL